MHARIDVQREPFRVLQRAERGGRRRGSAPRGRSVDAHAGEIRAGEGLEAEPVVVAAEQALDEAEREALLLLRGQGGVDVAGGPAGVEELQDELEGGEVGESGGVGGDGEGRGGEGEGGEGVG